MYLTLCPHEHNYSLFHIDVLSFVVLFENKIYSEYKAMEVTLKNFGFVCM